MRVNFIILLCLLTCAGTLTVNAQFNVDGQLVQRSEYRNGTSQMIAEGEKAATFIAHRARLQAQYKMDRLNLYMSIQDIRVWGNTPQVKATDNFLSLHEAWAEVQLADAWSVKLGRQELNYDNFRFLGNLDWALQGRAHDIAMVKYEKDEAKLHFGAAYNQDAIRTSGNLFTTANQYKTAQMARYENKFGGFQLSLLFWNDGRQFYQLDNAGNVASSNLFYRQTIGAPTLRYSKGNSQVNGFYYHQLGKDPVGRKVNAFNVSLSVNHKIVLNEEKGSAWTLVAGTEILSGTPSHNGTDNRSYNPLYGTNHLFNGYMDLFYVGGMHENSVGLSDYFLKGRYAFNSKFFLQADVHAFFAQHDVYRTSADQVLERMEPFFGNEVDLSLGYIFTDAISLQSGYSQFFATDTFAHIQGKDNPKSTQNWAYLMLIFRPTIKNKFIGILL